MQEWYEVSELISINMLYEGIRVNRSGMVDGLEVMRCIFEAARARCPYKGRDFCNLFEVLARQRVAFDPFKSLSLSRFELSKIQSVLSF